MAGLTAKETLSYFFLSFPYLDFKLPFVPIFHLPHFLRQCFFKWVATVLVLESPGVLVNNGDSWSYSKRVLFHSSGGGGEESAFLMAPQVIVAPTEKQVEPSWLVLLAE